MRRKVASVGAACGARLHKLMAGQGKRCNSYCNSWSYHSTKHRTVSALPVSPSISFQHPLSPLGFGISRLDFSE